MACSHALVPTQADDMPNLATNEEWRRIMVRARKEPRDGFPKGLSQEELGRRVGCSQVQISKIENGEDQSSTFILPICRVLGIEPPEHFANEKARAWSELGSVLRHDDPDEYDDIVAFVEAKVRRARERRAAEDAARSARPEKPK